MVFDVKFSRIIRLFIAYHKLAFIFLFLFQKTQLQDDLRQLELSVKGMTLIDNTRDENIYIHILTLKHSNDMFSEM